MNENHEATDQLEEVSGRWLRDQLQGVASDPPPPEVSDDDDDEVPAGAGTASTSQLIDGLAASISSAVAGPIRTLEARREANEKQLEGKLDALSGKLGEVLAELGRVRDQSSANHSRVDEALGELGKVREQASAAGSRIDEAFGEIGRVREQASSAGSRLDEAFGEIGKVREQASAAGSRADEAKDMAKRELEAVRGELRKDAEQINATSVDLRDGFNRLAEEVGRLQERVREQHERLDALRFRESQRAKALAEVEKASSSLKDALSAAAALSSQNDDAPARD